MVALDDPSRDDDDGARSPLLDAAVRDAAAVLDYCVRTGASVDPAVARTIVSASRGEIETAEQETSFWLAFSTIAAAARPATVDGLRHGAYSGASSRVGKYQIWAWVALALLILFQVDWLIGSKLLTDLNDLDRLRDEQIAALAEKQKGAGENAGSDPQIAALESKIEETIEKLRARVKLLQRWNDFNIFARLFSVRAKDDQLAAEQAADFQVRVLQLYVLPLLYGWLGASIFILRNVSRQIIERSFSSAAHRIYQLREAMGALAGLAIAWVVGGTGGTTQTSVTAISPVALAFVAGYSVDILFTGIDKVVTAFAGSK